MTNVSIYPFISEVKNGAEVSLYDIMEGMRSGHWKKNVDPLREMVTSGATSKDLEPIKAKLPYFTASGTFSVRRDEGLIRHSGKLAIDFDKIPEDDRERVRQILINDQYSEFVFKSCTGRGFCIIINIDPAKHLESFLFIQQYYREVYNINVPKKGENIENPYFDQSCKDLSRPRYISHDENLFHNPDYNSVNVSGLIIGGNGTLVSISSGLEYSSQTIDDNEEKYDILKKILEKTESYVEGNRHLYILKFGFFLNRGGVDEDYTRMRFMSEYVPDKDPKELERIIIACYANTIDFGVFPLHKKIQDLPPEFAEHTKLAFRRAHERNETGVMWTDLDIRAICNDTLLSKPIVENIFKTVFEKNKDDFGLDNKNEVAKIESFIKKRYDIVRNEITSRLEYKIKGTAKSKENAGTKSAAGVDGNAWQKINIDSIYRDLQHANLKYDLNKLKSLLRSDFVLIRNPIKDYFYHLPKWDETMPDYISELAGHIKTDNDSFWHTQFKKALVRNIACAVDYIENRIIIVMAEAQQNTGKTNFIRFLCPQQLKEYYTETVMDASKDSDMQLSENFIWNLEELAALQNNEINKLKATISKSVVKQRRAYGEFAESNPRRCTFWASTNKTEFLTDDQNTRWLVFSIKEIDHNYNNMATGQKNVNIDNVWSQAWALYKSGYNFQLSKEEGALRDSNNSAYELGSMEKDLIITHLKPVPKGTGTFMSNTDILLYLQDQIDNKVRLNMFAVTKAMRQLKYEQTARRVSGKPQKGFFVGLLGQDSAQANIGYEEKSDIKLAEGSKKRF